MYKIITRTVIIGAIALLSQNTYAQVGIGTTTPDSSAALDITSTKGGILIPRISLVNVTNGTTPINTPATSLLVYNTNATLVGGSGLGFYYWDGSEWVKFSTRPTTDWAIKGNTGTTSATDFIGTTDTQDFVVRTDNTERIRVTSNGKVGISENNPTNATLEVSGNTIIGNTFTGGTAVAQTGGLTVEGRTIIGEDDFYYNIDKVVVYGNTDWIPTAVTNGDNGNGLTYAINGYTSDGVCIYGEDNDGGIGVSANVSGTVANRATAMNGFDISGTGYGVIGISQNAAVTTGYIGVQGIEGSGTGLAILSTGNLGYTAGLFNLSDKRLKENVKPIENALKILNNVNPKYYDMKWKDYKGLGLARTPQMGFIAQELEQVLPHLVTDKTVPLNDNIYSKEELIKNPELAKKEGSVLDVKMVNYVQMVPLLTQAIKEQQEIIKSLEARIDTLERK